MFSCLVSRQQLCLPARSERKAGRKPVRPTKGPEHMRLFALTSFRILLARKLPLASAAAMLTLAAIHSYAQPDPPAQAGRLSYITGNVSYQPVGSDDFGQAFPNLP